MDKRFPTAKSRNCNTTTSQTELCVETFMNKKIIELFETTIRLEVELGDPRRVGLRA